MQKVLFLFLAASPLWATPAELWRIGKPDNSYAEFFGNPGVLYQVGRDDASAWPRSQRSADRPAVRFSLPNSPAGVFQLRLHLLFRTAALPGLRVLVNGRHGDFVLHPEKTMPSNDFDGNSIPYNGRQSLRVDLPAAFFVQGENQIQFLVIGPGDLLWDAIEFSQDPSARLPACDVSARLEPTVFWRKKDGVLLEQVNLIARPGPVCGPGSIEVLIGGSSFQQAIGAGYAFGDLVFPLQVPVAGAGVEGVIRVTAGKCRKELKSHLVPARKWKLYVASTTHLDIGYTARQADTLNTHLDNIQASLGIMNRYPEFRWNVESAWLAERFLQERKEPDASRLLGAAGRGRLGVNSLHSNLQASLVSLEEWNRATEAGHDFGRASGAEMDFASLSDVPSLPWELPTILHHARIRYLANGANQLRAPLLHYGLLDEKSPFFWQGPDGSRVLCWFTKGYGHAGILFGIPGLLEQARSSVPYFLGSYPASYPYDAVLVYGFDGDNAPLRADGNAGFYRQWNALYEYPRIVNVRYRDFFTYVESQGTGKLPVLRGDGGAYWEDGVAQCPRTAALNRRNQAKAVEAEVLASIATLRQGGLRYPAAEMRSIWNNILLFDEHTFGKDHAGARPDSIEVREQWAVKEGYALRAAQDLRWEHRRWLSRLAGPGRDAVLVWNPSSWTRSDVVEIEIPAGKSIAGAPAELLSEEGAHRTLRFLARDVPPLHFRAFPLVSAPAPAAAAPSGEVLENEYYRIAFDTGRAGVRSILDKTTGRELVDPGSSYALGEFLRVIETSSRRSLSQKGTWDTAIRTRLDLNSFYLPPPTLEVQRPRMSAKPEIRRTALGSIARLSGSAPGAPRVEMEVRLWNGLRRVDIIERITKPRESYEIAEAVYFAFPLRIDAPVFRYDRALGWVNPAKDMLPGSAPEWFAVNSAVNVSGAGVSLTLATPDAPLVTLGDFNRGRWPRSFTQPDQATVFSYVYNNYWLTNFPAGQEQGDFEFRYSLTSSGGASRFGEEARHPLLPVMGSVPAEKEAPVAIDSSHIHLVTMKRTSRDDGYLIRLAEESGQAGEAVVRFPGLRIRAAHLASTHGEPLKALAVEGGVVRVPLPAYGQATLVVAEGTE